eukprot:CAMPEP_0198730208 /NCGR_PEP_ID=MMETSP1475-20131203/23422_1 /TAXON_ID= ORGANISM="Unidentified sp., Strain CCMP1999" /NCGR_SAMPLE_ID=MMETSP1475 /ASSEMBLY_ACC=CAM_ASM_001111 /LENGTH=677 /DNA_ID=CAMNT_0044492987 /DNA_START=90 /DNA_END=2123 /DNA_ORIENTATION=+
MSRRAIRRLEAEKLAEKLREAEAAEAEESVDEDDSSETNDEGGTHAEVSKPAAPRNAFELLGEIDDDEPDTDGEEREAGSLPVAEVDAQEEGEEPAEDGGVDEPVGTPEHSRDSEEPQQRSGGSHRAKGKKRKEKRRSRARRDKPNGLGVWTDEEDDFFQSELSSLMTEIEEQASFRATGDSSDTTARSPASALMNVDPKRLQSSWEMRRIFGARAMQAEFGMGSGRVNPRTNQRSAAPVLRKKLYLVTPRDTWAPFAPGLGMEMSEDPSSGSDGVKWFNYSYSKEYARIQGMYFEALPSYDPNSLVAILNHFPYHVDAMLQLAEAHRAMHEPDRAAELVEQSLCLLERAWHVRFKPFDGSCRLSFTNPKNRSLFVALFLYAQNMAKRGLQRTAFEVTKLLYNLEPERDPLGALLSIDTLALQSGEAKWLLDMVENFTDIPVKMLPNIVYSAAFAAHKLGEDDADDRLREAISCFPMVMGPLLQACSDISGVQYACSDFNDRTHAIITKISLIYAERAKLVWTEHELPWLRQIAEEVAKSKLIADRETFRSETEATLEGRQLFSSVRVGDLTGVDSSVGRELVDEPVGVQRRGDGQGLSAAQHVAHFFSQLLPSATTEDLANGIREQAAAGREEQAAAGGEGQYELGNLWTSLEEALQDTGPSRYYLIYEDEEEQDG